MNMRVKFLIDGLTMHISMKTKHRRRYLWFFSPLIGIFLAWLTSLFTGVDYFLVGVKQGLAGTQSQEAYIQSVETTKTVITYGNYRRSTRKCSQCGATNTNHE